MEKTNEKPVVKSFWEEVRESIRLHPYSPEDEYDINPPEDILEEDPDPNP